MLVEQYAVLGVLLLPLMAAIVVWLLGHERGPAVRAVSVAASLLTLALAVFLTVQFNLLDRNKARQTDPEEDIKKAGTAANYAHTFVPEFVPGSTLEKPHETTWNVLPVGNGNVQFFLGIDGLNVWLITLTALLMLPCVLVSFTHVTTRVNEFYAWLLALQTTMIGVFLAFDVVFFYTFFELTLVPLFFLIGIWGGADKQYAARKFFVYTLTGSLITLVGVLITVVAVFSYSHPDASKRRLTFSIPELVTQVNRQLENQPRFYVGNTTDNDADREKAWVEASAPEKQAATRWAESVRSSWSKLQIWVFLAMSLGFAVKVPLMPFHTWLPLAHTEAPTAGSVDLAGVLLKLGCYGFLRLCIPLAPDASVALGLPLITWISAIGIVYGAFCAFAQADVKKLIAYSSVSHLGVVMLGMFSLNVTGLQGSMIQMINHGLSTPLLFLLIGMLYERYHTRKLGDYGGMAQKMPLFAAFLVFSCLSSAGMPLLNGFVGEYLCLAGIYEQESNPPTSRMLLTAFGASGMLLGAWYLWTMLRRLLFGTFKEPHGEGHHGVKDLQPREWGLLAPLVLMCCVLGVYPWLVLRASEADMKKIASIAEAARERVMKTPARADAGR